MPLTQEQLCKLRQSCFGTRERFERTDRGVWCFQCNTDDIAVEFRTGSGWYEGPLSGTTVERVDKDGSPYKMVQLSDPDGQTPVCPWCHSSTLLLEEDLLAAGYTREEFKQVFRELKARYVVKTQQDGIDVVRVLDE